MKCVDDGIYTWHAKTNMKAVLFNGVETSTCRTTVTTDVCQQVSQKDHRSPVAGYFQQRAVAEMETYKANGSGSGNSRDAGYEFVRVSASQPTVLDNQP